MNPKPRGLNVYQDKKKRVIYVSPTGRKAYYIIPEDYSTYTQHQHRYLISLSVCALLIPFLANRWILVLILSALVALLLEIRFLFFLKKCQPVKKIQKDQWVGYFDLLKKQDKKRTLIKSFLYIALGLLLTAQLIGKDYNFPSQVFTSAFCVLCVLYGCLQLYGVYIHK